MKTCCVHNSDKTRFDPPNGSWPPMPIVHVELLLWQEMFLISVVS